MKEKSIFKKAKKSKNGFLANGIFIPKEKSNRHYIILQKWIEDGGKVEKEFGVEELKEQKITEIKNEASRRITNQYSITKQRNILISQDANSISAMNVVIQEIRKKSNITEGLLKSMTFNQLKNFDANQEENWN